MMNEVTLSECQNIEGGVIGVDDVLVAIAIIDIGLSLYSLFSK
jgi:hypothetical protein